jgi:hypothetical protein
VDDGLVPDLALEIAHLIRPVDVFEDQHRRLGGRDVPDEQPHSLEELRVIGRRRVFALRGLRLGQ